MHLRMSGFIALLAATCAVAFTLNAAVEKLRFRDPGSYYNGIDTKLNGTAFRKQLTTLVSKATALTYTELWTAFQSTDMNAPNSSCPGGK